MKTLQLTSFALALGFLFGSVVPLAAQRAGMDLAPNARAGQTVSPIFEGWYRNLDGTFTFSFGYINRNLEEVIEIPIGPDWQYEPKWDGFRCIAFRDGKEVYLQSKSGQPLARYFPEIAETLLKLKPTRFVLDGELVIPAGKSLSFNDLLLRIHPAASRVGQLFQLRVHRAGKFPRVSGSLGARQHDALDRGRPAAHDR